jgi:ABC-type uncharacterized transport system permease subunit
LQQKKYKETIAFFILMAVFFVISLQLDQSLSIAGIMTFKNNLNLFYDKFVVADWFSFNHSIFSLIKGMMKAIMVGGTVYESATLIAFKVYTISIVPISLFM